MTDALRRELELAKAFTGHRSNQSLIDEAVRNYLLDLRRANVNFSVAAEALAAEFAASVSSAEKIDSRRR